MIESKKKKRSKMQNDDWKHFGLDALDPSLPTPTQSESLRVNNGQLFRLLLEKRHAELFALLCKYGCVPQMHKRLSELDESNDDTFTGNSTDPLRWYDAFTDDVAAVVDFALEQVEASGGAFEDCLTLTGVLLRPDLLFRARQYERLRRLRNSTRCALGFTISGTNVWYIEWSLYRRMRVASLRHLCERIHSDRVQYPASRVTIVFHNYAGSFDTRKSLPALQYVWSLDPRLCNTFAPPHREAAFMNLILDTALGHEDLQCRNAIVRHLIIHYDVVEKYVAKVQADCAFSRTMVDSIERRNALADAFNASIPPSVAADSNMNLLVGKIDSLTIGRFRKVADGIAMRPLRQCFASIIAEYAMALQRVSDVELYAIISHALPHYVLHFMGYFSTMGVLRAVCKYEQQRRGVSTTQ